MTKGMVGTVCVLLLTACASNEDVEGDVVAGPAAALVEAIPFEGQERALLLVESPSESLAGLLEAPGVKPRLRAFALHRLTLSRTWSEVRLRREYEAARRAELRPGASFPTWLTSRHPAAFTERDVALIETLGLPVTPCVVVVDRRGVVHGTFAAHFPYQELYAGKVTEPELRALMDVREDALRLFLEDHQ
jgi:hypothetical protein